MLFFPFIPLFQFHYGTIKSLFRCLFGGFLRLFQFHYGTIKRFLAQLREA